MMIKVRTVIRRERYENWVELPDSIDASELGKDLWSDVVNQHGRRMILTDEEQYLFYSLADVVYLVRQGRIVRFIRSLPVAMLLRMPNPYPNRGSIVAPNSIAVPVVRADYFLHGETPACPADHVVEHKVSHEVSA